MRALRFYCSPVLWARANWFSGVNALLDSSLFYLFKKKFFLLHIRKACSIEREKQPKPSIRPVNQTLQIVVILVKKELRCCGNIAQLACFAQQLFYIILLAVIGGKRW